MSSNIEVFLQTLPIMLWGMLGVFFVIVLIMIAVKIMNVATRPKKKKPDLTDGDLLE